MPAIYEVFGAPGVGKSALCNETWSPSVPWDRRPHPREWATFLQCAARLERGIRDARSTRDWRRMFDKAARKLATLSRMPGGGVYAGAILVMRGLDLYRRIPNGADVADYFHAMPMPAGAISLYADAETIRARNLERAIRKPNRQLSGIAPYFEAPRLMAVEILKRRGVPVLELDTRDPIASNIGRIHAFVGMPPETAVAAAA